MKVTKFDALQTFYVDSASVNGANEVYITSIDVYYKSKPNSKADGRDYRPGTAMYLCPVENDSPALDKVDSSTLSRVEYDAVYAFADASMKTRYTFKNPILVSTNRFYGMVLVWDDPNFDLWKNVQGDRVIGTNSPSPGINSTMDGKYYAPGVSSTTLNPLSNVDLKYNVNVAKFSSNTMSVELVNGEYEFLSLTKGSQGLITDETVWKVGANSAGKISIVDGDPSIVGTNTSFTTFRSGDKVVVMGSGGYSNVEMHVVSTVVDDTHMVLATTPHMTNASADFIVDVVGSVYFSDDKNDDLILAQSTANVTNYIQPGDRVRGLVSNVEVEVESVDTFRVDRLIPSLGITSTVGRHSSTYNFAYYDGSDYRVSPSNATTLKESETNFVEAYEATVLSRSLEVNDGLLYDNVARKSAVVKVDFTIDRPTDALFTSPSMAGSLTGISVQQSNVSSTPYELRGGYQYDTEVGPNGLGKSKHVSKRITFDLNRSAEDLFVFAKCYRPTGTDIRAYARVHSPEDPMAFDDMLWTPLEMIENAGAYSSTEDEDDWVEYSWTIPDHPSLQDPLPMSFTLTSNDYVVTSTGTTVNTYVTTGDVVKIYDPLQKDENFVIATVTGSNTTTMTISEFVEANNSLVGSGKSVAKVMYETAAWRDKQNDGVVSYFNEDRNKFGKFDTMQVKLVFFAEEPNFIPRVDRLWAIGTSA